MKKIITLIIAFCLVCSIVSASRITVEQKQVSPFDLFIENLMSEKYISGQVITPTEVQQGAPLGDVKIRVTYSHDAVFQDSNGYATKLQLYFVEYNNPSNKVYIKTVYGSTPFTKGAIVDYTVKNIDTELLGNSWCDKLVWIGGYQSYYTGNNVWVKDELNVGSLGIRSETFKLKCATSQCESKYLRTECNNGFPVEIWQSDFLVNGVCGEQTGKWLDACPTGTECYDGDCIEVDVCTAGTFKCDTNNHISIPCINGDWSNNMVEMNICYEDNLCNDATGKCGGEIAPAYDCTSDDECNPGEICNANGICEIVNDNTNVGCDITCVADALCNDGITTYMKCENGCLNPTPITNCNSGSSDSSEFNIKQFVTDNLLQIIIVLLVLAIIGYLIYARVYKRKRK